jgi:hypothetical protein
MLPKRHTVIEKVLILRYLQHIESRMPNVQTTPTLSEDSHVIIEIKTQNHEREDTQLDKEH